MTTPASDNHFNADAAALAAGVYDAKMGDLVDGEIHKEPVKLESPTKIEVRTQIVNVGPPVGPNKPCPCGSGKKNKKCCKLRRQTQEIQHRRVVVLDPDVAKALKQAKRQGKTVRMK